MNEKKIEAAVYNFAFGDAWGFTTEFKKFPDIIKNQYPVPEVLKVSDDTQMGLYTLKTIRIMNDNGFKFDEVDYDNELIQNSVRNSFARSYVKFYYDEDNNRAPGVTCMTALEKYIFSFQRTGFEGGVMNNSLGCGTVMRTPWLGLLPYSRRTLANLAVLQAQTTHGDPVGWIISAALTLMIKDFVEENNSGAYDKLKYDSSLFNHAYRVVDELVNLNLDLLKFADFYKVKHQLAVYADHWDEVKEVLAETPDGEFVDVTRIFGEGWIADEALYNALAAVSLYEGDSEKNIRTGVKRLVYSNGDSDSLAAIGGALWGAKSGILVQSVEENLEKRYRNEIREMIDWIVELNNRIV